jgi:curli biogenesis system outer membrane secretion channel CsgG
MKGEGGNMKKPYLFGALVLLAALLFTAGLILGSCSSSPPVTVAATSADTSQSAALAALDAVIEKSYGNLSRNMKSGARIALLPLGVKDKETGDYVYDTLTVTFVNSLNYDMVERKEIEKILQEQDFQISGLVDDKTAVGLGEFLGAEVIIIGEINGTGSMRRLVFRALDVRTAKVAGSSMIRL